MRGQQRWQGWGLHVPCVWVSLWAQTGLASGVAAVPSAVLLGVPLSLSVPMLRGQTLWQWGQGCCVTPALQLPHPHLQPPPQGLSGTVPQTPLPSPRPSASRSAP